MAAPHAFLDILANAPVRDAYLAGRVTLLLSADIKTVLWSNGAGARFMGFATVAESLAAPCRFDAVLRRRVEEAAAGGAAVLLPGAGQAHRFLASRITLAPWGEVVFLRSVAAAVGRNGLVDLTDGLSDETSEAALFDLSGRLMYADTDFNPAIGQEPALPALLAEAFESGAVHKRLLGAEKPYPVGVLRLNKEPPVFLMIAARRRPAAAAKSKADKVTNIMRDQDNSPEESDKRHLSQQEQEAFAAIAQRLQQSLQSGNERPQSGAAAAVPAAAAAPSPAPAAEKTVLFAGLPDIAQKAVAAAGREQDSQTAPETAAMAAQQAGPAQQPGPARPEPDSPPPAPRGDYALPPAGAAIAGESAAPARAENAVAPARTGGEAARAAAMADLRYQKNRLDFLLNVISEAVLIIDKNGAVRSANAAAARLFGYQAAALPGKTAAQLLAPSAAATLHRDIKQALDSRGAVFLNPGREAEGRTAQGNVVKLRLNFGCLEPGKSYFLLIRDMTRFHDIIAALLRKNNEEAQAVLRQSRYFALISHEIRTPLNAILGMAQFMAAGQAGEVENDKYKEYLGDILRAGEHIMTLVNDILALSRDKTEWPKIDKQPIALAALLKEVVSLMIPQANAANIIMRSNAAADLPPVWADNRAVRQILLNLLGNAVHFTPEGGQIMISAHELPEQPAGSSAQAEPGGKAAARRLLLRISDTGIGMSAGQIARSLRDPRSERPEDAASGQPAAGESDAPVKTAGSDAENSGSGAPAPRQGAGLGLPMAYALAEANNIRLSLSSEPGKGTVATLLFPIAAASRSGEESSAALA